MQNCYLCGMKIKELIIVLLLPCASLFAQESRSSIFDALGVSKAGEGVVLITQSPAIQAVVGTPDNRLASALVVNGVAILQGYKIQAYSGNLHNSRTIANRRQHEINSLFPELAAMVEYDAPFWRVRVGNFVDQSEAQSTLVELRRAFPAFAREMYIVRTQVKVAQ